MSPEPVDPADPVGQQVRLGPSRSGPWITIIGVVGDVRQAGLDVDPLPEIYLNYASNPPNSPFIAIRTAGDHRIAMAFAIAALTGVGGAVEVDDPGCVAVSYPGFWDDLAAVSREP